MRRGAQISRDIVKSRDRLICIVHNGKIQQTPVRKYRCLGPHTKHSRVSHMELFCKIIAVAGERLRRWPQCDENKIANELATGRMLVFASPFEGAIPEIELCGFRQGTKHSTQGLSRLPKGHRTSRKKRCSAKLAAISTRHRGICELLRGLLQDGVADLKLWRIADAEQAF